MPIWPFKKRRRSVVKDEASQPLTEKAQPSRAATYPPATATQPIPIPRKSSKRGTLRKRRPSPGDEAADASWAESEKAPRSADKENVPPSRARMSSREDITALPMSRRLESSPHLRPVDLEKPPIPYNFRTYSGSQSSLQREPTNISSPPRPVTLRSRRSGYDSVPSRMQSAKRKKDDQLREEEIRAMSAQMPIPKRPGEGPLRRDSKKLRGLGAKDSSVSLPPAEDSITSMSAILEQRGWEIGSIDVFNPRPAVRLSGTPQYVSPGSLPNTPSPTSLEPMKKDKEKMPASRGSGWKRDTIGNRADDFDASDIRMLLERDAKRREKRKKDQQEKLDKKLRSRGGRNRGDSDRRRREAEEVRRAEEAKLRAEDENRARDVPAAPAGVHPALRDTNESPAVGLGIGEGQAAAGALESDNQPFQTPAETPAEMQTDPFADPVVDADEEATGSQHEKQVDAASVSRDVQMKDTLIETAQEVPMSQVTTPPMSPVHATKTPTQLSQVMDARRLSDLTPPAKITDQRRVSDPKPERRAGAWATFFRRGGTKLQRGEDGKSPTAEKGFANVSRESMRNQPLPSHLVDTSVQEVRRKSGTPTRTQSKFREDLPEMPISPPDSRLPSPDVTTAAAAAAAAGRAGRSSAQPQDVAMAEESDFQSPNRNDTPISPSKHRITSMASIDSEGSWLASGSGKRTSTQSALAQRRPEFTDSYEELGGDKDAEYVNRPSSASRKISSSALAGPDPEEESGEDDASPAAGVTSDPMTMHESVRRQPTLVHRDPRVKSREGLLTEYSAGGGDTPVPTSAGTGRGSLDFDSDEPEPELQRASSVGYGNGGKGHARQISAGSAKLREIGPRTPTSQPTFPEEETSPRTPAIFNTNQSFHLS